MNYATTSIDQRALLPPAVAVSTVAFALHPPEHAAVDAMLTRDHAESGVSTTLWIPLVRRTRPPFADMWALPGGPIPWDETLVDTALRTLCAAVHHEPGYLEQLYSFGAVGRSADAQRLVTIAYWALYGEAETRGCRSAGTDLDPNVAWFSADRLPELAFDHAEIVAYALTRLRVKTEYSELAHRFLGRSFTLAQLRSVTEAIRGEPVDPANFRRQVLARGNLLDTGETLTGGRHRPARLYRFREDADEPLEPDHLTDESPTSPTSFAGSSAGTDQRTTS